VVVGRGAGCEVGSVVEACLVRGVDVDVASVPGRRSGEDVARFLRAEQQHAIAGLHTDKIGWVGSGGGDSETEVPGFWTQDSDPFYEQGAVMGGRAVPDIAMDADPNVAECPRSSDVMAELGLLVVALHSELH